MLVWGMLCGYRMRWGMLALTSKLGQRRRDVENTGDVEMSVYFTDTGVRGIYIYIYREREISLSLSLYIYIYINVLIRRGCLNPPGRAAASSACVALRRIIIISSSSSSRRIRPRRAAITAYTSRAKRLKGTLGPSLFAEGPNRIPPTSHRPISLLR